MDRDEAKKIKRNIIEIEKQEELAEFDKKWQNSGLVESGEFKRLRALIVMKYEARKDLVGNEQLHPAEVPVIQQKDTQNEVSERKPFLKDLGKKNLKLRRLQDLFIKKNKASYGEIAKTIGLNTTLKAYQTWQKSTIVNLQKQFNLKAKRPWKMRLVSTKGMPEGLELIHTKHSK